jgi:hypothetical protein
MNDEISLEINKHGCERTPTTGSANVPLITACFWLTLNFSSAQQRGHSNEF